MKQKSKEEEEEKKEWLYDSDCDSDTGIKLDKVKLDEDEKQQKQFKGVMLAENWAPDQDPTGFLMSEKLDGVRAFWNGSNLYSR